MRTTRISIAAIVLSAAAGSSLLLGGTALAASGPVAVSGIATQPTPSTCYTIKNGQLVQSSGCNSSVNNSSSGSGSTSGPGVATNNCGPGETCKAKATGNGSNGLNATGGTATNNCTGSKSCTATANSKGH